MVAGTNRRGTFSRSRDFLITNRELTKLLQGHEQKLNAVILKLAQGILTLTDARTGHSYRIECYAYYEGGHEVQRVEELVDGEKSWLYCIRRFLYTYQKLGGTLSNPPKHFSNTAGILSAFKSGKTQDTTYYTLSLR